MTGLKLWLLGQPRVELDDAPIELRRRKALALLVYLAVTREAQRRDSLATLFWPEADQSSARTALRRDLSELNRELGQAWLDIDRESIRLKRGADPPASLGQAYWLDLDHFHHLLAECTLHGHPQAAVCPACLPALGAAVELYRGEFLAGFTLRDSPEFDEWQFFQAETLRGEVASALERLVHGHSADGEEGRVRAIPYARHWLALDPLNESAHRHLMQLYAGTNQHAAALRQYGECVRILNEELSVPPSAETIRLYQAIKSQRTLLPPATTQKPLSLELVYPVAGPQAAPSALLAELAESAEPPARAEPSVFVAQEQELAQLDRYLDQALAGRGLAAFVIGEAGSGKTALVQEFARRAQTRQADLIVVGGNCNAYTGIGDPYLPFREILAGLTGDLQAASTTGAINQSGARRLSAFAPGAIQALVKAGPDLIDTFVPSPALVGRMETAAPGDAEWLIQLRELAARRSTGQGPTNLKQLDLFEQYGKVIQALAGQQPLLLVLEDLHWADTGSISLLFHLGRRLRRSRILVIGIYRSTEIALGRASTARQAEDEAGKGARERHPLESLVHEFQLQFGDILVDLGQAAGQHFVDAFLDSEPNQLGPAFREALYRHTRGHALFTVEMLRGMQERGDLIKDEDGRWVEGPALNWEILPARVEGVIAERIGRLSPMLRELLKVASVEGEVFTAEVVSRVQMIDERLMVRYLSGELDGQYRLIQNQSSRRLSPGGQPMSQYRFRHILFQKYLYNNLDDAECMYLHEAVGQVLERLYGDRAGDIAVQLARHYEAAGWPARAIDYLQRAGDRAVHLSANEEALAHFAKGLALLEALPDTPERNRQELDLQIAFFAPLAAVKGYAASELGQAYGRARELCRLVDDAPRLFVVTYGLWGHNLVRMNLDLARELAQQCLALAQASQNPAFLLESNRMMGETAIHRGELVPAREFFERSRALYDPERHHAHAWVYGQDPGVALLSHGAWTLWHLGYPDRALAWSHEARALAQAGSHPFSTAFAEEYASILHQMRGEDQESLACAEAVITLAHEQRFGEWLLLAESSRAWIRVEMGDVNVGITQLRQGLDAHRATGSEMFASYYLTLLARAHMCAGQADAARAALDEALTVVERTEGRLWEVEIYRLRGELLLSRDGSASEAEAEACYLKGLAIARQRQARSLELRAVMSLCRLWQWQGKIAEAQQLLAETYNWFTEGFDTADLREARALLDVLV